MFTNSLQLFAEQIAFQLSFGYAAAGIFLCTQPDQYGVFADAFNFTPLNDDLGRFSKAQYASLTRNHDRGHRAILDVDLDVANASQLLARAQIDHVLVG